MSSLQGTQHHIVWTVGLERLDMVGACVAEKQVGTDEQWDSSGCRSGNCKLMQVTRADVCRTSWG